MQEVNREVMHGNVDCVESELIRLGVTTLATEQHLLTWAGLHGLKRVKIRAYGNPGVVAMYIREKLHPDHLRMLSVELHEQLVYGIEVHMLSGWWNYYFGSVRLG